MIGRGRPARGGPKPRKQSQGYTELGIATAFPREIARNLAPAGNDVGRPCGRPTADGNAETAATPSITPPRKPRQPFPAGGGLRSLAPAHGAVAGGGEAGATGTITAPRAVAWSARSLPRLSRLDAARHGQGPKPLTAHALTALTYHEAHARTQARTQASRHSRRVAISRDRGQLAQLSGLRLRR